MAFDQSVFHPQGGGQPSDVGKITNTANGAEVAVQYVSFNVGTKVVTHRGKLCGAFSSQPSDAFRVNDEWSLVVDEETRFRFSELHTAGHMVDSAMLRCGYDLPPLKGYHFAEGPYVEYRGKVEHEKRDPLVDQLKEAFAALAEEDIVTTISTMPVAEAQARLSRTAKNIDLSEFTDSEIRIVSIAGLESACGGTHVRSTKQLRDYTVTGIKVKKDVVRIKYDRK